METPRDVKKSRRAIYDFSSIVHCHQPATTSTSPGCQGQGRCTCNCNSCNGRKWVDADDKTPCQLAAFEERLRAAAASPRDVLPRCAPMHARRVIPERADVAAESAQHIVIEPREDFLFDKLVLATPDEDFRDLVVESVRVGKWQILTMPTTAALFSRAQVYPGPAMPPLRDPAADMKDLLIGMWNVMNDRPARFGMDDEQDGAGQDAAPGTSPGGIYLRPDETIEIDVRNARTESVLLGVSIIGTVIQK
jgi:hypothetical protein